MIPDTIRTRPFQLRRVKPVDPPDGTSMFVTAGESASKEDASMPKPRQGPSSSSRQTPKAVRSEREPESPAYDKKLDGPNRPSI
jgi:hypothetical protein